MTTGVHATKARLRQRKLVTPAFESAFQDRWVISRLATTASALPARVLQCAHRCARGGLYPSHQFKENLPVPSLSGDLC